MMLDQDHVTDRLTISPNSDLRNTPPIGEVLRNPIRIAQAVSDVRMVREM